MSSSFLRLSFAAAFALILPTLVSGQNNDEPPQRKDTIQDPFAEIKGDPIPKGNPIPLTQEDDDASLQKTDKDPSKEKTGRSFSNDRSTCRKNGESAKYRSVRAPQKPTD